jgi:hypothetical protein
VIEGERGCDSMAYRILCGVLGSLWIVLGFALIGMFFRFQTSGFGSGQAELALPLDGWGVYMAAMAGCAMVGWGGGLIGAARRPDTNRSVGTFTALALVLMAFYRIAAWAMGDYPDVAMALRVESVVFLLLALAFVWLRPRGTAVLEAA